jgi:hypothetical protein
MPPSFPETIGPRLTEPHLQLDSVIERHDVERLDIRRRADDAFV